MHPALPVKSIRFSGNQAHIIGDECILCGHCFVVCPQNAKEIVNDTERVKVLLQGREPGIRFAGALLRPPTMTTAASRIWTRR